MTAGAGTPTAPGVGMTTETKRHREQSIKFVALEVALEIIRNLRGLVIAVRRHDAKLAEQLVSAASSVAANLAEGNRRSGRDRGHLFRIAAGSADETRTHLRVAVAWGYLSTAEIESAMATIDRELGIIWGLTH